MEVTLMWIKLGSLELLYMHYEEGSQFIVLFIVYGWEKVEFFHLFSHYLAKFSGMP